MCNSDGFVIYLKRKYLFIVEVQWKEKEENEKKKVKRNTKKKEYLDG